MSSSCFSTKALWSLRLDEAGLQSDSAPKPLQNNFGWMIWCMMLMKGGPLTASDFNKFRLLPVPSHEKYPLSKGFTPFR